MLIDTRWSPKRNPEKEEKRKSGVDPTMLTSLSTDKFYDSEETQKKRKIEEGKKKVRELDREEKDNPKWCVHFRQQEMFEDADNKLGIFPRTYFCEESAESHGKPVRKYFAVKRLDMFWKYYYKNKRDKHCYELMREDTQCHLYFDLEFSREANPDVDGESLVDHLLELIVEEFDTTPEIDSSKFNPKEHVIELDSTSATKFSRHLIIKLPDDQVFENNSHCAHFVRKLMSRVESRRGEDARCDALFLKKNLDDVERTETFIDLGVYTRNRVFRVYLSSKYSEKKDKPALRTTGRFWKSDDEEETFKKSLASAMSLTTEVKVISFEGVTHTSVLRGNVFQGYRTGSHLARPASEFNGNSIGPCPRTAEFVCKDFNRWSGHGGAAVRSWTAFPEYGVLVLNLFGNRFCENIERSHRSNNVMFVVDFREGAYYQRCYDPDCRGTRGPWHELNEDVLDESHSLLKMLYERPSFEEIDDEELAVAVPTFDGFRDEEIAQLAATL